MSRNSPMTVEVQYNRYTDKRKFQILDWVLLILGYKQGGSSTGDKSGIDQQNYHREQWKWVKVEPKETTK